MKQQAELMFDSDKDLILLVRFISRETGSHHPRLRIQLVSEDEFVNESGIVDKAVTVALEHHASALQGVVDGMGDSEAHK